MRTLLVLALLTGCSSSITGEDMADADVMSTAEDVEVLPHDVEVIVPRCAPGWQWNQEYEACRRCEWTHQGACP